MTPPAWMRLALRTACAAIFLMLAVPARAEEPSCDNPRAATSSLLDWLQPDTYDPVKAAACLDIAPEKASRAPQIAVQLKSVLDARGLYVPVASLPLEPDHKDAMGQNRLVPVDALPVVYLEKKGDRWLYSRETMGAVPRLYKETFSAWSLALQDRLPAVFLQTVLGLHLWQFLYFVLLALSALLAGWLVQLMLSGQVIRLARRFGVKLTDSVVASTRGPITLAVTGIVFLWGIPDLQLAVRPSQALHVLARATLSLAAVLVMLRVVDLLGDFFKQRSVATESKLDDQIVPLVKRAAKVGVVAIGVVFVLQNLGVDVGGLVAGLGIGGLALALAAKDSLENFFGSIVIFSDRPFQIGDYIVIEGGTEGTVEAVGFRCTRVRTPHNSLVSVPNGKIATSRVDNMGMRHFRRIRITLGLTYDTPPAKIEAFVSGIREYLAAHEAVADAPCLVHFHDFNASSLDVLLNYFVNVPGIADELRVREEHFMYYMKLSSQLGVSFAFPSTSLYVESLPPSQSAS